MKKLVLLLLILFSAMTIAQEINDPLTTGLSKGVVSGGTFSTKGWTTTDEFSSIQYDIATCAKGSIEFDVTGLYASNDVFKNCYVDKQYNVNCDPPNQDIHHQIFNMWDRDDANAWWGVKQWHNPYKAIMHVYGYTPGDQYKWNNMKLRLNVAAYNGGYDDDPHAFEDPAFGPMNWTKDHIYHFKLIWGEAGHMKLYVDGDLKKDWDYSSFGAEYAPPYHSMRLGSAINQQKAGGFKCPTGITYSNFKFYRDTDTTAPYVTSAEPSGSTAVACDSDILIDFSESMDPVSTASALEVSPVFAYTLKWIGGTLWINPVSSLSENTTYNIRISSAATDKAGNPIDHYQFSFKTYQNLPTIAEKYQPVEFVMNSTNTCTNPYTEVALSGTFTGPTKTIKVDGFWDGDKRYKVRYLPIEVGTVTYTITSTDPSLNRSGTITITASSRKGIIGKDPVNKFGFMYSDGTMWQWRGETSWRGYTNLLPYNSRWKEFVDLRVSQGFNAIQSIVHSFINDNPFWANEGGQCFAGTTANYDLLNPMYFRFIDKRIDYANSKGMVPIMFFTWAQDYESFSADQFIRYSKYIVARYANRNAIFVICGEYNELSNTTQFDDMGRVIDPMDPYDHLLTLHPTGRTTSGEFGNSAWQTMIGQQTPYSYRDILRDRQYNKPVVNLEPRYFYPPEYGAPDPNDETRMQLWEIVCAGGYYTNGFYTTYAPDKGGYDIEALPDEQQWVMILNRFIEKIELGKMAPFTVTGAQAIKGNGNYLLYNRSATTVAFTVPETGLEGIWLNPRTGAQTKFSINTGSNSFTAPFTGDWVLFIGPKAVDDIVPPSAPKLIKLVQ